jgi:hypothetical protein
MFFHILLVLILINTVMKHTVNMSRFWLYYVSLNTYNLSIESYYLVFFFCCAQRCY